MVKSNIETKTVVAHAIHSKCNHPKRKKAESRNDVVKKPMWECPVCKPRLWFGDLEKLKGHVRRNHPELAETKTLNCPKCGSKDVKEDKISQSVDVENWQSMPISINTWGYKCQKCGTFFSVQEG